MDRGLQQHVRCTVAVTAADTAAAALQAAGASDAAAAAWHDGWVFSYAHEIIPALRELYFPGGRRWYEFLKADTTPIVLDWRLW